MPRNLDKKHNWAVILAGGDGTRLQELTNRISGDSRPKQFCKFFGEKSLLTHTRERIAPLFGEDQSLFALAQTHERFYGEELSGVDRRRLIVQPANRGTAVAIALSLQSIASQDEDALVAFFPSDHHYVDCSAFRASVAHGLDVMGQYPDSVLILGAAARYAETEYGWIEPGRTLIDSLVNPLQRVSRFWEKPPLSQAEILHQQGCLWNTFVTIGSAGAFMELLWASVPELMRSLDASSHGRQLDQVYDEIPSVDFSRTVLTTMPNRLVVLRDGASGWTDFGSPRRVADVLSQGPNQPSWLPQHMRNHLVTLPHAVGRCDSQRA